MKTQSEIEEMLARFLGLKEYDVHRLIEMLKILDLIDKSNLKPEEKVGL